MSIDLTANMSAWGEPVDIAPPPNPRELDTDQLGGLFGARGVRAHRGRIRRGHPLTDEVVAALREAGHEVEPTPARPARKSGSRPARRGAPRGRGRGRAGGSLLVRHRRLDRREQGLGARAALCVDAETARMARKHNHANVLALSLRSTSPPMGREILEAFLDEPDGDEEFDVRTTSSASAAMERGIGRQPGAASGGPDPPEAPRYAVFVILRGATFGPVATNTYVVADARGGSAWIVDPAMGGRAWVEETLKRLEVSPVAVLDTHGHWDHVVENHVWAGAGLPVWVGAGDEDWVRPRRPSTRPCSATRRPRPA